MGKPNMKKFTQVMITKELKNKLFSLKRQIKEGKNEGYRVSFGEVMEELYNNYPNKYGDIDVNHVDIDLSTAFMEVDSPSKGKIIELQHVNRIVNVLTNDQTIDYKAKTISIEKDNEDV